MFDYLRTNITDTIIVYNKNDNYFLFYYYFCLILYFCIKFNHTQMDILRIKEVLKEKGVTSKDLALSVGITENALSMISNGKRQPRFELLIQIASALDVDVKDLFVSTKEAEALEPIYMKQGEKLVEVGQLDTNKIK